MAGEWIKVTLNLHTKPEVFRLARILSQNVDTTVGMLIRFWAWADGATVDGAVDGIETQDVDAIVKKEGFCEGLISVGWLQKLSDRPGFELVKFARHNGESAKKRALKNERQARWRDSKVDGCATTKASAKTSTREEKRREEKINTNTALPRKPRSQATALPEDFCLSDRVLRWAAQQGLAGVIELHFEAFVSTCKAKGYSYVDWDEAFMNAVRKNWAKIDPPRRTADGRPKVAI